ncbi:MAG: NADH-quinone oxidoreductase subunit N [Acidimicrobiia bacterium]|nr:NADH-quinone oxidoreductase subunit N [Acidimicrobiia bacterium]
MNNMDFLAIGPEIAVTIAVVLLLMIEVGRKPPKWVWGWIAGFGLAAAIGLSIAQWVLGRGADAGYYFSDMLALDGFSSFGGIVVFTLTALGLMASWRLVTSLQRRGAEFVALVLIASAGMHLMAASAHLIMLFIALEVASISFYVLVGIPRDRADADEAALKYFLLGAFASAVFLYGIALIFAATGSLSIYGTEDFLGGTVILRPGVLLAGIAMLIVGLGFKVSAAPFHVWAPDVYQGAPSGITGFLAAGAKVGGFAAMARVLTVSLDAYRDDWAPAVAVIAVASVVIGTLLAIAQDDIKRMLAYSSVAHAGFILLALTAGDAGVEAVWFYLATYAIQVIAAFAVVAAVTGASGGRSPLDSYAGLGKRAPFLAGALGLMMLAMAGIPMTTGFIGKLGVFRAAIDAGYLWAVITALVATVAGLFFYLRVIVRMYMETPDESAPAITVDAGIGWTLALTSAATIALGVAPWPLLNMLRDALPL